ncbi:MAG: 50S ribosomal protein L10 [Planctomycetes bacterium]|nr:50S ribosomal protein L10 [Planctomycetota bacterium]
MSKRVNRLMVEELAEFFKAMDPCVLISYQKVTAEAATKMRAALREKDIDLRVIKNSLSQLAMRNLGHMDMADMIDGPIAMAKGGGDPIVLAKAVAECTKGNDALVIRGGYAEGKALDASQIATFARMPGREGLLAQILSGINGPLVGVAGMFASIQRSLATALKAIADQKAEQAQQT